MVGQFVFVSEGNLLAFAVENCVYGCAGRSGGFFDFKLELWFVDGYVPE